MRIHVQAITSEGELKTLAEEWHALLAETGQDSLFLTWEWVSSWWHHLGSGSRLFLLCVRDLDAGLIGLAPFRIVEERPPIGPSLRVIHFLGTRSPAWADDLDIIAKRGREAEVLEAITNHLLARRDEWDVACLTDLGPEALSLRHLSERFHASGLPSTVEPAGVCPYLPLTEPWTTYEERARRKFRDLGKYLKAIEHAGAALGVMDSREMLDRGLDALVVLNRKRVEAKADIPSLSNPGFEAFVRAFCHAAAERGWLRLYYAAVGDQIVGVNLNFAYGRRVFGYLSGFDPAWRRHGMGTCLFYHAIHHSWASGQAIYDFLRGEEEYKYRWTSHERRTVSLRVISHRARHAAFRGTEMARRSVAALQRRTARLLGLPR